MLYYFYLQGNTSADLIKPMISSIKELWDCSDPVLQRDANYIMTALAGEQELTGDCYETLLEMFFTGSAPQIAGEQGSSKYDSFIRQQVAES